MASLATKNGIHYISYRYPPGRAGKRYQKSLSTGCDKEAAEAKVTVERAIKHLKEGVITLPPNARDDELWQFLRSGGKASQLPDIKPTIQLVGVAPLYLEARGLTKEESTVDTERIHIGHFYRIFGQTAKFHSIGQAKLRHYIDRRSAEPGLYGGNVSGDTIRKELQTFRQLWEFAKGEGYVDGKNPLDGIELPKRNKKGKFRTWKQIETILKKCNLTTEEEAELWGCLFLYPEEITEFLAHVEEASKKRRYPFIFPAIAFCAYTGARRSEMFRCRVWDIGDKDIDIREKKRNKDTEETIRTVPIHDNLKALLDNYDPIGPFMFGKSNGNQLEDRSARDAWDAVTMGSKWERLRGFHVLRHSFISILAMNDARQDQIRELAGHGTDEMYYRYCHLFPEQKEEAIMKLGF